MASELDWVEAELGGWLQTPHSAPPAFGWLGQAGFVVRHAGRTLVLDPYLSDALAKKYRGTHFPHLRLMPPPVSPERLHPVDAVFCSHAHTDHMDPETLPVLARCNPRASFVVPRASFQTAVSRGVPADRAIAMNAGETVSVGPGLRVHAVASAHETLQTDEQGNHRFLGYVIEIGDCVFYHAGDGVPYEGLAPQLQRFGIRLAILPVNGRDAYRQQHGVPGNFTLDEAVALCVRAGIEALLPCHFGMFAFNTLEEAELDRRIAALPAGLSCLRPRTGHLIQLNLRAGDPPVPPRRTTEPQV